MDLMIFLIFVVLIVIVFKDTKSLIYFVGMADVFMRLVHFIKDQVNVAEFSALINRYIPTSIMGIVGNYASGIFYTILAWFYIIIMCWFLGYLIKYLIKG